MKGTVPHVVRLVAALSCAALSLLASKTSAAATLVIDNIDPAGQGFNDTTPFSPIGGNNATTLGAARLAVFQRAGALWGAQLESAVVIRVQAQFTALPCTAQSATLAETGASTIHSDFANAPFPRTWYPQALANALAGTDLDPSTDDIDTEFNSSLGGTGCMPGTTWYLGFDGQPGPGQIDILTTLLHEFSHGLGFQTFEDPSTGAEVGSMPDVFMVGMREQGAMPTTLTDMTGAQRASANVSDPNLYWSGANVQGGASTLTAGLTTGVAPGHVRLYAPATVQGGSSLSHYSTALTPNELMEPIYTGPNHNLALTKDLLEDLGWQAAPAPTVPDLPGASRWGLAAALAMVAVRRIRRGPSRCTR
jgi:hypothetical protein